MKSQEQFSFPGNACAAQKKLKLAWLVSFLMFTCPCGCEYQQPASSLLRKGHTPEAIPGSSSSLTLGTSFTALCLLSMLTQECAPSGKDLSVGCLLWSPVLQWPLQGTSRGSAFFTAAGKNVALVGVRSSGCLFVCLFNILFILCGLHIMQLSPIHLPVP